MKDEIWNCLADMGAIGLVSREAKQPFLQNST